MRALFWGQTYVRALKRTVKKHPNLKRDIEVAVRLLQEDPFAPQLETHKLKGKLLGSWACRAGYDLRIVFAFMTNATGQEDDILLLEIGTHEEVY